MLLFDREGLRRATGDVFDRIYKCFSERTQVFDRELTLFGETFARDRRLAIAPKSCPAEVFRGCNPRL